MKTVVHLSADTRHAKRAVSVCRSLVKHTGWRPSERTIERLVRLIARLVRVRVKQEPEPASLHECSGELPCEAGAEAIGVCFERANGTLWAGNSEYESQVAYCPYCGFMARVQPKVMPS